MSYIIINNLKSLNNMSNQLQAHIFFSYSHSVFPEVTNINWKEFVTFSLCSIIFLLFILYNWIICCKENNSWLLRTAFGDDSKINSPPQMNIHCRTEEVINSLSLLGLSVPSHHQNVRSTKTKARSICSLLYFWLLVCGA